MELEEVSELIVECIDRIKSIITEKTGVTRETTLTTCESEGVSSCDRTVHTNSDTEKLGAPAVEHERSGSLMTVDKSLEHSEVPVTIKLKLPKIELPKFNDNVTKFCSFWETFKSSVDHNPNLSTIDKFNYLKALL